MRTGPAAYTQAPSPHSRAPTSSPRTARQQQHFGADERRRARCRPEPTGAADLFAIRATGSAVRPSRSAKALPVSVRFACRSPHRRVRHPTPAHRHVRIITGITLMSGRPLIAMRGRISRPSQRQDECRKSNHTRRRCTPSKDREIEVPRDPPGEDPGTGAGGMRRGQIVRLLPRWRRPAVDGPMGRGVPTEFEGSGRHLPRW